MDARPWQFSIKQALTATALVAIAAWFAHYTAVGTEPTLRLAGLFIVPVLLLAAVGTATRQPLARRYGVAVILAMQVLWLVWMMR
jgi:hypothetical protein